MTTLGFLQDQAYKLYAQVTQICTERFHLIGSVCNLETNRLYVIIVSGSNDIQQYSKAIQSSLKHTEKNLVVFMENDIVEGRVTVTSGTYTAILMQKNGRWVLMVREACRQNFLYICLVHLLCFSVWS